ncbi:D-aminoacyl-tRNA deacylase [Natronoarchaeum philippinense]|uniref:D-aminoacyl-tRNA deacylase n=1 Tax=Natronoarchaeum philippinense TaxID=558529 RepID=A0A285P832_NATPI|nr:D-aminoacyl-tRNA deacylase [Natronoarchaeum philippinense]SNZ17363.1 D-aminoacyl-tRNA deacylase [Natronoarchaeum philippinense]
MIAIVVSRADFASEHIGEHLLSLADWDRRIDDAAPDAEDGGEVFRTDGFELRTFDQMHLDIEAAADAFDDPDLLVFASRHAGDTGPLLTAHFTGNFGPAKFGGEDNALATSCPRALSAVVDALDEYAPPEYDVGVEATHHGPTAVGVPSMFVELGSDEPQWDDPDGARAVAQAILDLDGVAPNAERRPGDSLRDDTASDDDAPPSDADSSIRRHVVGIGGGHYAPRFERVIRETDWHVGHIGADWALTAMGEPDAHRDVLDAAFERSGADLALVDGDHEAVVDAIEDLGYRTVGERWLRETDDVPLSLVSLLEAELSPVEDGLRFGVPAREGEAPSPTDVAIVDLPDDLLADAQGVDADAAREAVERFAYGFETAESGTRIEGAAAFPASGDAAGFSTDTDALAPDADLAAYDDLIAALAELLAAKYDTVERHNGHLLAEVEAFDPELASAAGVPEGPAFGKLSNGQPVEVDGERIAPEDVQSVQTETFEL